jgi:outer membrane protein OmpA-like peptidoglycan-associated protein
MKKLLLLIAMGCSVAACCQTSYSVYFMTDSYEVSPASRQELESWIKKLPAQSVVELYGFCDNRGTDQYNDSLSKRRTQVIRWLLMDYGIPLASIIIEKGYGEKMAKSRNDTEEGRRENRRVDIKVLAPQTSSDKSYTPPPPPQKSITEAIADSTVKNGTNIVLRNINFRGGMHQILPGTYVVLNELLAALQQYPTLVIQIQGHICCEPGDTDGLDIETGERNLSEARAKAIHDYLIGQGIDQRRLSYKGFGHSKPLFPYPEQSEGEQVANRRVEIKIVSK